MTIPLHILSISFDDALLDRKSDAFKRHVGYSSIFASYTVVLLSKKMGVQNFRKLSVVSTESVSRYGYIFDALRVISKLSQRRKFSLVTCQDPFITGTIGVVVKLKYKLPLNIQVHSEFFNSNHFRNENFQNLLFYYLGLITIYFANTVRARNNHIKNHLLRIFPRLNGQIFYVGMQINQIYLTPISKRARDKNVLVWVGRLAKQKNLHGLIDFFEKVNIRFPRSKLLIVGNGEERSSLEQLVDRRNLRDKVEFKGSLKPPEIKKIFDRAGLFVLSSHHEGWALVCLEALARGLPVVMTNTGCANEIVVHQKTGYVASVNDMDELADWAMESLSKWRRSLKMALAGRQLVLKDCDLRKIKSDLGDMFLKTK